MDANVSTMTMPKTMPVQNLCRYDTDRSGTVTLAEVEAAVMLAKTNKTARDVPEAMRRRLRRVDELLERLDLNCATALKAVLPPGLRGAFGAAMLGYFISTRERLVD